MMNMRLIAETVRLVNSYFEAENIMVSNQTIEAQAKDWYNHSEIVGADGLTWCVFGDDTYAIKEQLKELGCKFSPLLKCPSVFKKSKTKCLLLFFLKIMI